jgi:hypothetical protein
VRASPPVTLVTAIYERTPDDALGGRDRPLALYFDSMSRLAHLGAAWVIYTDPAHVDAVRSFGRTLAVDFEVVARSLDRTPRFEAIQDLRERLGVRTLPWRDRCHALCFAKIGWTAAEAASPRFGSDFVYWIDAGLAHEGLFPSRLRRRPETVFTPQVLSSLQPREVTLIAYPYSHALLHDVSLEQMATLAGLAAPISRHVVGGLFGGRRDQVLRLALECDALHGALLNTGLLGTEENLLSLFAARHPEFPTVDFDTWYHEETDFTRPAAGAVSFHVLFERWAGRTTLEWPFAAASPRRA